MDEIHIVSCVVRVRPRDMAETAAAISALRGSEVFASHSDGRLVVVLEASSSREITSLIETMHDLPAVLSVEMAYQHAESAVAMQECLS